MALEDEPREQRICPKCNGEKFVQPDEIGRGEELVPCPLCEGKGTVPVSPLDEG
jgi:DnaJ-class molecular chaperone